MVFFLFQETVVKALGSYLDNDTLETLTRAEQLSANLTDLNERIEGSEQQTECSSNPLPVLFVAHACVLPQR